MATKTVQLKDFADELEGFMKGSLKQQQQAVANGVIQAVPELIANSPVDTGQYASSWDFTIDEKSAVLGNYAPHAPIIEKGARPFTPPLSPLLAWAKRVLQDPSQPPNYSSEVWALAKGTQQKIASQGMKPKNVLENAIPGIIVSIKQEMKKIG